MQERANDVDCCRGELKHNKAREALILAQVQQVFALWVFAGGCVAELCCPARGGAGCPGLSLLRAIGCAPGRCRNAPGEREELG